jgi:hypothetical protein
MSRPPPLDQWRDDLTAKYGAEVVDYLENGPDVPWPCRDTMDGRRWCRVHDAPWPSGHPTIVGCEIWIAARLRAEEPHDA